MIPFAERSKIELLEFGEHGMVKLKIPFKGNENHVGTMYAGSLWSLAEFSGLPFILSALGGVEVLEKFLPVVAQFDIKFYKPVKCDIYVTLTKTLDEVENMENSLLMKGKAKCILEGVLVSADGTEYGRTTGVYVMI
jgi:thioesterase domain-containing protein